MHTSIKNLEPWVTKGVIQCIRKQKNLHSNLAKDKGNSDKEQKYLNYRKVLQKVKRQCKKNYYTFKCSEHKSNTKQLWKLINKCSGKLSNKSGIIDYLTIDGLKQLTISKVLEKLVYKCTYSFLDTNKLLYESQYGFRSKYSCENAITELTSEILKGAEWDRQTLSIFLDLSKAFDTLSHDFLLWKLKKYGIRGTTNHWFKSYLSDRKLRSKCNIQGLSEPVYSTYHNIDYGTPQGSCLGPLLFMIFVNDLHKQLQHCKCILFADDTTIFISHKSLKYMKWCIEEDLQAVSDWFRANKLTLNVGKSAGILFDLKGKSKQKHINIQLENEEIPLVNETKFLGVWMDSKLDWHLHADKVLLKIKCNMNLLQQSKKFLPSNCKRILYHAQIQSHIAYDLLVWGSMCSKQKINKIHKLQNQCLRLISNKKHIDTHTFKNYKILTVEKLTKLELCKTGYKLLKNDLPVRVINSFITDINNNSLVRTHNYNTCAKNIPWYPHSTLSKYSNSFLHQCLKSYSELPVATRNIGLFQLFMSTLKRELLDT